MKTTKRVRRDAKRLFGLCLVDGVLNQNRAREVVRRISEKDRRDRWPLLRYFARLLKRAQDQRTATVESATELPQELRAKLKHDLIRRYGVDLETFFVQRPELIGGLRIKVGSDVYDGSIRGGLMSLEKTFGDGTASAAPR
jgi:F-type H+-transporting ATPase subunit delta